MPDVPKAGADEPVSSPPPEPESGTEADGFSEDARGGSGLGRGGPRRACGQAPRQSEGRAKRDDERQHRQQGGKGQKASHIGCSLP